jgi:hypothetical protein
LIGNTSTGRFSEMKYEVRPIEAHDPLIQAVAFHFAREGSDCHQLHGLFQSLL